MNPYLVTISGCHLSLAPLHIAEYRPLSRLEQVATGKLFEKVPILHEKDTLCLPKPGPTA